MTQKPFRKCLPLGDEGDVKDDGKSHHLDS